MPYGEPRPSDNPVDELKRELPNILVLAGLLLLLLILLTRFHWIHCSQVFKVGPIYQPTNWCQIYCDNFHGSKSKIAIVYGDSGIGDPNALRARLKVERPFTEPVMLKLQDISAMNLDFYDLVIVEHAKRLTLTQADAIASFIKSGKAVLWIGDSGTEYYVPVSEQQEALRKNQTVPGYYEAYMNRVNFTIATNFGPLATYLGVKAFNGTLSGSSNMKLDRISSVNLITSGLADEVSFPANSSGMQFANVEFDPVGGEQIFKIVIGDNEYPAIIERKAGRTESLYVAFPLENSPSKALITNIFDYIVLC